MQAIPPLEFGKFYHIYNRGINSSPLFKETGNYEHFLKLYDLHIEPIAETYTWCLMKNHFHFLIRIKEKEEMISEKIIKPSPSFLIYSMPIQKLLTKNTTDTAHYLKGHLEESQSKTSDIFKTLLLIFTTILFTIIFVNIQ